MRPRTLPAAVSPVIVGSAVAAHDHRLAAIRTLEPAADAAGVGNGSHCEDARQIQAWRGRANRRSSRREHEYVVRFVALRLLAEILDANDLLRGIDREHLHRHLERELVGWSVEQRHREQRPSRTQLPVAQHRR